MPQTHGTANLRSLEALYLLYPLPGLPFLRPLALSPGSSFSSLPEPSVGIPTWKARALHTALCYWSAHIGHHWLFLGLHQWELIEG